MEEKKYDAVIIGAGPAGMTAAIYLARARVKTLLLDSGTPGGQMLLSYEVANYPGVEQTSGRQIATTMLAQAKSFGCDVITHSDVIRLELDGEEKIVEVEDEGTFVAPVVILAMGGVPRTLGMESEKKFQGLGISYCATCDGDFFTDKEIAVIGGGNSALEEAVSLTKYASKVTIIHEFDEFQAQPWVVQEAKANPKIHYLMAQKVLGFEGDESLEKVISENKSDGKKNEVVVDGCFIFIGYVPNTESLKGKVELNERGEIITDEALATNIPGVFAAGDSRVKRYRQITTSVGDGTIAALSATEYLREKSSKAA